MKGKTFFFSALLIFLLACNLPSNIPAPVSPVTQPPVEQTAEPTLTLVPPPPTTTPQPVHYMSPSATVYEGFLIYDVESSGTGPEKRAPYGDSYNINRLERPFTQDMTYIPDLDIYNFSVNQDANWYYVSVDLIGADPNNALGINYGLELDINHDGFGDHLIWATPPYMSGWDASNVKIYSDTNHNSAGASSERSDAPISTDGYETLTFNGGAGDADPDLAWVRINVGEHANIQFAFKTAWSGNVFMLGVIADAGLKDVSKLDYVDRFTEAQAGSPVKDKKFYPLKELYLVDNTCQEAFGFKPTGYEPKLCPHEEPTPKPKSTQVGCYNPTQYTSQSSCQAAGCNWVQGGKTLVYYYCAAP